jgi:hypothetical protein
MAIERIPGFCALCRSRCGCVSIVEDGRLVGVEADPGHPTGRNLCVKGRAAAAPAAVLFAGPGSARTRQMRSPLVRHRRRARRAGRRPRRCLLSRAQ